MPHLLVLCNFPFHFFSPWWCSTQLFCMYNSSIFSLHNLLPSSIFKKFCGVELCLYTNYLSFNLFLLFFQYLLTCPTLANWCLKQMNNGLIGTHPVSIRHMWRTETKPHSSSRYYLDCFICPGWEQPGQTSLSYHPHIHPVLILNHRKGHCRFYDNVLI